VIPKPSQPRSREITLGTNTRRFIDRTNNITNQTNRVRKGSPDIYLDVKNITHAEIKQTTQLNLTLIGSKINGNVKEWGVLDKISHSRRMILLLSTRYIRRGSIRVK